MMSLEARLLACALALVTLAPAQALHAQEGIGTWKQTAGSMPGVTMDVAMCCDEGRRLTYHVSFGETKALITVESRFDGSDAPVMLNGKPTGETMAIKRLDPHHTSTVLKMNGKKFGTSQATLSEDGKTLTVSNEITAAAGGRKAGKHTEIWVRQ